MESNEVPADLNALRDAEQARDELAASVVLPPGHDVLIGASVAVYVVTFALGTTIDESWARWALGGSLVMWGLVALLEIWRFSRLNGVRVSGYAHKVVLGNAPIAAVGLFVAIAVAYLAATREMWWLVVVAAVGGAVVYVLSGRRWMHSYRKAPDLRGSPRDGFRTLVLLSLAAALAAGALVFLATVA